MDNEVKRGVLVANALNIPQGSFALNRDLFETKNVPCPASKDPVESATKLGDRSPSGASHSAAPRNRIAKIRT